MADDQARRVTWTVLGAAAGVALLGVGAVVAASVAVARKLVTPPARASRDGRIVDVGDGTVTLSRSVETTLPGRYGLWADDDRGYAKIGAVTAFRADAVTRELIAVEDGVLAPGQPIRIGAAYYRHPAELGVPVEDVAVRTPGGPAPAWWIPADEPGDRWAILVHGRNATRWECIRAVPALRAAGWQVLIVSYRNDPGAPAAPDGKYALGDREWEDVDAAIGFARQRGADRVLLMGWSMGGATVLRTLERTRYEDAIVGAILDSAAVDWVELIDGQLAAMRMPSPVPAVAKGMLATRIGARLVGLLGPLPIAAMRAEEHAVGLRVPVLVLQGDADRTTPVTAARRFAAARPSLVSIVEFAGADHVRLWNADPARYEAAIGDWLADSGISAVRSQRA